MIFEKVYKFLKNSIENSSFTPPSFYSGFLNQNLYKN